MTELPFVSICIPTYNRAGMVSKAIESALTQSYQNIEVLIVDNASDDNIESVIAAYHDPRLKFYKNDRNLGIFGNFNRCIELSHGEYIHILHSDDFIDTNFTKTCVDFMESHPGVMMTCGSARFLSNTEQKTVAVSDHDVIYRAPEGFKLILGNHIPIVCPSVMMKRAVYDSVGLYSCEYPYAGDFYQWLRISQKFDFAFVANAILYYREGVHSESFQLIQKTPLGYVDIIKVYLQIIKELDDDVVSYRSELNVAIRGHMYQCINAGIWQSKLMKSFSPRIFIGFALTLLTLIVPDSSGVRVNKFLDLLVILMVGFFILIPGGKYCLRKILRLKQIISTSSN